MLDCVQSFNILIYSALIFNLLANEVIPLPVIYLQSINGKIRIKILVNLKEKRSPSYSVY
jgi:hypothetical protein